MVAVTEVGWGLVCLCGRCVFVFLQVDVGEWAGRPLKIGRIQVSSFSLLPVRIGTETDQECIGDATEENWRRDPTCLGTAQSRVHCGELTRGNSGGIYEGEQVRYVSKKYFL